ncbi:MAG: hypothetical protein M0R66_09645 [Candidatus Omnitrophica bacterium]|nr:hypothetical protein [Candidatus Omnitrophota bacterium]
MKIFKGSALIILFMFIFSYAYAESYTTPVMKEEAKDEASVEQQAQKQQEQIKADKVCIGEDCRSKWPSFKCVIYDNRPVGETGDEFCSKINKTCVDVSIGGGQSFFDECSVPVNAVHKCRCCGVE